MFSAQELKAAKDKAREEARLNKARGQQQEKHWSWLFGTLWTGLRRSPRLHLAVPDTILFEDGAPTKWLASDRDGYLIREDLTPPGAKLYRSDRGGENQHIRDEFFAFERIKMFRATFVDQWRALAAELDDMSTFDSEASGSPAVCVAEYIDGVREELTAQQLDYLRFPLADLEKPQVRGVAAELGLRIAAKPDSQDICFVPNGDYRTLIDKLRPQGREAGEIVHMDGRVLGGHSGITDYTIGQRRGLNVAVGEPLFVTRLDPVKRHVIVGPREALLTASLTLDETNWLGDEASIEAAAEAGAPVLARVRSTRPPSPARLLVVDGAVAVTFASGEEGVAPGQACALYDPADPDRLLGGGFIRTTTAVV